MGRDRAAPRRARAHGPAARPARPPRPSARIGSETPIALGVRQAEILALLALNPAGLTCEQLTLELYGEEGNPISARAEVSRLRRRFRAGARAAVPASGRVSADFVEVERLLASGPARGARRLPRATAVASEAGDRARRATSSRARSSARARGARPRAAVGVGRDRVRPRRPARTRGARRAPARERPAAGAGAGRGRAPAPRLRRHTGALARNPSSRRLTSPAASMCGEWPAPSRTSTRAPAGRGSAARPG